MPKGWEVVAWIREYLVRRQIEVWCRDLGVVRCEVDVPYDNDRGEYEPMGIRLYGPDGRERASQAAPYADYGGDEACYHLLDWVYDMITSEARGVFTDSFEVRVDQPPLPAPPFTQQLLGQLAALARERTP